MANQKTHVVKRGEELLVLPPMADLCPRNKWKIVNHTGAKLLVTLSAPLIDDGSADPVPLKEEIAAGGHLPLRIHKHAKEDVYEYTIKDAKSGKKAKGNSDPMVIIDM
jgi:hypothetical protein